MSSPKTFLIWCNPSEKDTFETIKGHLERDQWTVSHISSTLALANYENSRKQIVCLAILNPSNCRWSETELQHLMSFHQLGNHLIVCSGDNEVAAETSLNQLVSNFGIRFRPDCLIRPNLYANYHPKEVRLTEFLVNRGLSDAFERQVAQGQQVVRSADSVNLRITQDNQEAEDKRRKRRDNDEIFKPDYIDSHSVIYAFGCTLEVFNKLSTVMMSSSPWSYPPEQPLCAFYRHSEVGRVVISGSASMFNDFYLPKEFNLALFKAFLEFIEDRNFSINISDARTIEIPEYSENPAILDLLDIPICCLDQPEVAPSDPLDLISKRLFALDCSMLPSIVQAYRDLGVPYEPLTLIKPKLQYKPLKLEPATHDFILRRRLVKEKERLKEENI